MEQSPTIEFYEGLQQAFDFFNQRLFEGRLPPCLLTLRSSNRVHGYHHHERFINLAGNKLDELGLHPGFFTTEAPEDALSTLVHEMVHHWQAHFGKPTPSNPHNHEWGKKMEEIGLMPSHTGLPGGNKTGRMMTHYIIPDGKYLAECQTFLASGFRITWMDRYVPVNPHKMQAFVQAREEAGIVYPTSPAPMEIIETLQHPIVDEPRPTPIIAPAPPKVSNRLRLMCPECQSKAWVAEGTELICGRCHVEMK